MSSADRAVISLAKQRQALLLVDDRRAREIAVLHQVPTIGTLGILEAAAAKDLLSLPQALERLRQTFIFLSAGLIEQALQRDAVRQRGSPAALELGDPSD